MHKCDAITDSFVSFRVYGWFSTRIRTNSWNMLYLLQTFGPYCTKAKNIRKDAVSSSPNLFDRIALFKRMFYVKGWNMINLMKSKRILIYFLKYRKQRNL